MKIVVVGGSHGIGLATVEAALAAGLDVVAFSRHATAVTIKNPKLAMVDGDVLDKTILRSVIKDCDAVICALGLSTVAAIGPPLARRNYLLSEGTKNIISLMQETKTKRLLCVTAIGTGDSASSCTPLARLGFRLGLRWLFKEKDRQEDMIKTSQLNWTIIRPTALTNGKQHQKTDDGKGRYGVLSHISRADVAREMVALLQDKTSYKQAMILSYPPRFGDSIRWAKDYLG